MRTRQRGSGWSIALVFNLYKIFGYRFIYLLMYPVTFFYFLFASNVKNSLKIYYKNIEKPFGLFIYFEHLRIFANCMVDRFITKLTDERYEIVFDRPLPKEELEQGVIMLHSHFGGWAVSANMADLETTINVVMRETMLDSIKNIENSKEAKENINIIDLAKGGIAVSIEIANALSNNEIVAMMGDRASNEKGEQEIEFFGKDAAFNKNPFQISYKVDKPVFVFFIIFEGYKKYKVIYKKIEPYRNEKEDIAVTKAMEQYINFYEDMINRYPNQWFNFYNFWEKQQ